ncbi:MAG: (2E,6E)-farnesyl diphosphate synthase [Pseudomonadota bacterium]
MTASATANLGDSNDVTSILTRYRERVDSVLIDSLPLAPKSSPQLHDAMRYAVTNGGKRVRPILVYATGEALNAPAKTLDTIAVAVELIHAYSLVHDDLPAMDDDDLRRGKPTCHKQFDEATAILAGDALQALAFSLLANDQGDLLVTDSTRLKMIALLGEAAGSNGMAWGQAIDLEVVGKQIDLQTLENMHRLKTGALIRASVQLGAMAAETQNAALLQKLNDYAQAVGLAFQIVDDILDVTSDTDTLGKPQGSDAAQGKPTYPSLLGLDGARRHAQDMHQRALACLQDLGEEFSFLRELSAYIVRRSY